MFTIKTNNSTYTYDPAEKLLSGGSLKRIIGRDSIHAETLMVDGRPAIEEGGRAVFEFIEPGYKGVIKTSTVLEVCG